VRYALVALAIAFALAGSAPAEQKKPQKAPPEKVPALHTAVGEIVTKNLTAKKGLRLRMPVGDLSKAVPKAARILGEYYLPLADAPFAPKGDWKGVVTVPTVEDEKIVDTINVTLLTGPYDRPKLTGWLSKRLAALGVEDFERDEEEPGHVWWGSVGRGSIWIAFGEGLIAMEFTSY
jgi:hypothetical protein